MNRHLHSSPPAKKPSPPLKAFRSICIAAVALACLSPSPARAQSYGPNLLSQGNFENVSLTYVPWAGVDNNGNIHGLEGKQIAVGEDGGIRGSTFGPGL